jgi:hypothetical protein
VATRACSRESCIGRSAGRAIGSSRRRGDAAMRRLHTSTAGIARGSATLCSSATRCAPRWNGRRAGSVRDGAVPRAPCTGPRGHPSKPTRDRVRRRLSRTGIGVELGQRRCTPLACPPRAHAGLDRRFSTLPRHPSIFPIHASRPALTGRMRASLRSMKRMNVSQCIRAGFPLIDSHRLGPNPRRRRCSRARRIARQCGISRVTSCTRPRAPIT